MDAVKYLKIKKRMTTGCTSNCSQCALYADNNPYGEDCTVFEIQYPEEAVAAVEKWAEEHPTKTRMDEFIEKYPKATVFKNDEYIDMCPASIDATRTCPNWECKRCKLEYWNEEVEE